MLADVGLSPGTAAIANVEANPISPDPAIRARVRDLHHWVVDCIHAMGGEVIAGPAHSPVGFFTGYGPSAEETGRCIAAMRDLADNAAPAGIRIAVEGDQPLGVLCDVHEGRGVKYLACWAGGTSVTGGCRGRRRRGGRVAATP